MIQYNILHILKNISKLTTKYKELIKHFSNFKSAIHIFLLKKETTSFSQLELVTERADSPVIYGVHLLRS